jgi:rare lipoprotein A
VTRAGARARRPPCPQRAHALLLIAAALLSACAQTPARGHHTPAKTKVPEPIAPVVTIPDGELPRRGNPPFYDVLGRRYHVLPSGEGYRERGIASWYGREFHGRPTASGEVYDMHAISAAHKTLPIPSYARVTNLRNGRSVVVRVNDRGPFVRNRIIDLSFGAAELLDITHAGTGIVEVESVELEDAGPGLAANDLPPPADLSAMLVSEAEPPMEPPLEQRTLYVQVGAFGEPFNAERLRQRLAALGFDNVTVVADSDDGRPLYRVRLGPLADVQSYDRLVERLATAAIDDIYLTLD